MYLLFIFGLMVLALGGISLVMIGLGRRQPGLSVLGGLLFVIAVAILLVTQSGVLLTSS